MHPPRFHDIDHLSDWPDCTIESVCRCGRSVTPAISLLRKQLGDPTFAELTPRLRCQACGREPAPVYLVAGQHRTRWGGPPPDWAVMLVRPPDGGAAQALAVLLDHIDACAYTDSAGSRLSDAVPAVAQARSLAYRVRRAPGR